jgi:hypothetical protein
MLRSPTITIKAKLKIIPKQNGEGRETPIRSGYRPNHVFEYIEGRMLQTYIGEIRFNDFENIAPGDEKEVTVVFLKYSDIEKYLTIGRNW